MKRSFLLCLFVLAIAFQISSVLYLDSRGAAHFHIAHDAVGHGHVHSSIENHDHHSHDGTVVMVEDNRAIEAIASEGRAPQADTALTLVVISEHTFHASPARDCIAAHPAARLQTQFPRRLERPPRSTYV